jgi:hypothetical protein
VQQSLCPIALEEQQVAVGTGDRHGVKAEWSVVQGGYSRHARRAAATARQAGPWSAQYHPCRS